ncbi:MAG: flagellar FlbD family protein [Planctomycetota bacterium]
MIVLTRLNGDRFVLNSEQIRTVEQNPDTVVTLMNGDHVRVKEGLDEVVKRSIEYGRSLRRLNPPA